MRLSFPKCRLLVPLGLLVLATGCLIATAAAQNADTLDPAQNAAKAKQLLQQSIQALGGGLYRDQSENQCEGRVAQFDHNGGTLGFSYIRSYWHFPDKNRTEYVAHSTKGGYFGILIGDFPLPVKGGEFIQVFNGDSGWTMDRGGVSDADTTVVSEFQDALKRQVRNLLLNRVNEEGVYLRYAGIGIADMREVDWIEFTDQNDRTVRLALDHESHLPLRTVALTPNQETRDNDEDITIFSNYELLQGVQVPMQITREHNGHRTHQMFYTSCTNAPNLPADFFTEQSLQKRFKETGGKVKTQK